MSVKRICLGWIGIGFILFCSMINANETSSWSVDIDFPGGNMILDSKTNDTLTFHPDPRDSFINECSDRHWAIRIKGAEGKTLHFKITGNSKFGFLQNRGPAMSRDNGKSWDWLLGENLPANPPNSFSYTFKKDEKEVIFALAPLYTGASIDLLLNDLKGKPIQKKILCKTDKGRDAELLRFGNPNNPKKIGVVLMSRNHANEIWGAWVVEGIVREVLSGSPEGNYLLDQADFFVVPLMDKDGVEDGDQGKSRKPHDHNRDFDKDRYPTVRELKKQVIAWGAGKTLIGFDFHSGTIGLRGDRKIKGFEWIPYRHFFCLNKTREKEERRFSKILFERQKGGFVAHIMRDDGAYDPVLACSDGWMSTVKDVHFVIGPTSEVPAVSPDGKPQTIASSREFGRNFARAIYDYIQSMPEQQDKK